MRNRIGLVHQHGRRFIDLGHQHGCLLKRYWDKVGQLRSKGPLSSSSGPSFQDLDLTLTNMKAFYVSFLTCDQKEINIDNIET